MMFILQKGLSIVNYHHTTTVLMHLILNTEFFVSLFIHKNLLHKMTFLQTDG